MQNRKVFTAGLLVGLFVVSLATARMIAPPSVALRVAAADLVVVGKVTGFADKTVKADLFKGDEREMSLAKVKVDEALFGKAGKEIQVGFFPTGGGRGRGYPGANLKLDQEAVFLLTAHPSKKGVYVAQSYFHVLSKADNPEFKKQLDEARLAAKALANPQGGLKSKDADERFLTAAVLITRYRTPREGVSKTEAVPAEESKLILQALAGADWEPKEQKFGFQMQPRVIFARLGLTAKDGWMPPKDFQAFSAEAKKFLQENAGKIKLERYVSDKKGDDPEPEPGK